MKFKYMIRGLGIGVIMTAAVMGAYNRQAVADARVAVLKEYGIGEESRLVDGTEASEESEASSVPEETTQPVIVRNEEKESEIQSVLDEAVDNERSDVPETPAESMTAGEEASVTQPAEEGNGEEASSRTVAVVTPDGEQGTPENGIQITISRGDDSGTISRKLYNAGLIENADEYDAFLMQHGYDKKLSTGTKNISATDSWQEIAEKLTRK